MYLTPVEQYLPDCHGIRGWASEQRGRPLLVFLHGNGFASGIYLPMLRRLFEQFDLLMLDIPGHGRSDNISPFVGWNGAAELVHSAARASGLLEGRAVYGVGHSLGGALTILSAYKHQADYQGLVLLDPIIFPPHMMLLMRAVRVLGLTRQFHPHIKATLRRRRDWDSRAQLLDYLKSKAVFKAWTAEALESFARYATRDKDDGITLACKPETEAAFFATLPRGLWKSIEGLSCPVTLLMGQTSYPFAKRAAVIAENRNSNITQRVVKGSHCFMQEEPAQAAQQIIDTIRLNPGPV